MRRLTLPERYAAIERDLDQLERRVSWHQGERPTADAGTAVAPRFKKVLVASGDAADDVKDGADYVCSGTADEVTINAALLDAVGGECHLTEGFYDVDAAPLDLPDFTVLTGAINQAPNIQTLGFTGGPVIRMGRGSVLENVRCVRTSTTDPIVEVDNAGGSDVEAAIRRCTLRHSTWYAIEVVPAQRGWVKVDECYLLGGVQVLAPGSVPRVPSTIERCVIESSSLQQGMVTTDSPILVRDCAFRTTAAQTTPGVYVGFTGPADGTQVVGCNFQDLRNYAVHNNGSQFVSVVGCVIHRAAAAPGPAVRNVLGSMYLHGNRGINTTGVSSTGTEYLGDNRLP